MKAVEKFLLNCFRIKPHIIITMLLIVFFNLLFARIDLYFQSTRMQESIRSQYALELWSADLPAIARAINRMTQNGSLRCVLLKHDDRIFFGQNTEQGSCQTKLFEQAFTISVKSGSTLVQLHMSIGPEKDFVFTWFFYFLVQVAFYLISLRVQRRIARLKAQLSEQRFHIVNQVVHDLRGPLSALKHVSLHLPVQERPIAEDALSRIQGMVTELNLKKSGQSLQEVVLMNRSWCSVWHLFEKIIKEFETLNVRFSVRNLSQSDFKDLNSVDRVQSFVNAHHLGRLFSNVLNNAVEALPTRDSVIEVRVLIEQNLICVDVMNLGKPFSPHLLARLGEKGMTEGKLSGNGFGIYHAKLALEAWGGSLMANNLPSNEGVCVSINLPVEIKVCHGESQFVENQAVVTKQDVIANDVSNHVIINKFVFTSRIEFMPELTVNRYSDLKLWVSALQEHFTDEGKSIAYIDSTASSAERAREVAEMIVADVVVKSSA